MLIKAFNRVLIIDRERTYLTAASSVGATTITIRAVDSNAWADNDYIIIGEVGTKNSEVLQLNGAVSDGTSLTIDNNGSGGARYAHAIDEPVYRIDFNRAEFSRATTETGAKTVLATNELQPDDEFTRYEDPLNTSGYAFVRFYNSTNLGFSDYSVPVPYTGYASKALFKIIENVRRLLNERAPSQRLSDDDIIAEVNEKQRDIFHRRLWTFAEEIFSFSSVANTLDYELTTRIATGKVHSLKFDSQPLAKVDSSKWDILHWDTNSTGDPTHFSVFTNRLRCYPLPTSAATSTTLNGAITAAATSITLTSTSSFRAPGRVLIDSEVISYDAISSTQLLGCRRGLEGTTAAIHADTTTVTERDFIGTGHLEPTNLVDMNDETPIPDPRVLEYGAAMELAITVMNDQGLHDRLKIKYDQSIADLEDKFSRKVTSQFYSIKDKRDVVSDFNGFRNPNDYPTNLS